MSQENVALHRRAIEAFNQRDLDGFLALKDSNVEFTPYERALERPGAYRGHADLRLDVPSSTTSLLNVVAHDLAQQLGHAHVNRTWGLRPRS